MRTTAVPRLSKATPDQAHSSLRQLARQMAAVHLANVVPPTPEQLEKEAIQAHADACNALQMARFHLTSAESNLAGARRKIVQALQAVNALEAAAGRKGGAA